MTKLRVIYNASAKGDSPSPECLYAGYKFEQRIYDLLVEFQVQRIAVSSDIEKAVLMISTIEEDHDELRFL